MATLGLAACAADRPAAPAPVPTSAAVAGTGWPTYLPSPTQGGKPHGSVATPAMSYPGAPVVLDIGPASVTVALDGPAYPPDTPVGSPSVDCTFTVVLSDATRTIDLSAARFDVLDNAGGVHQLLPVPGPLPASVAPGQTVTIKLRAILPSGEGLVRLEPTGSTAAIAWDYVAETD